MFNVYLHEQGKEIPKDDICYLIGKQGIFIKKKLGLIESLTPVKQISILDSITPYAKLYIPKIPGKIFAQILQLFKDVYQVYNSECTVLIFYREKDKKFKVYVPKQTVSYASVDYKPVPSIPEFLCVCSIHSHPGFGACHSGVDIKDEETFDGIHMTVGYLDRELPEIVASVAINGFRVPVNADDYIENMNISEYTNYTPNMFTPSFTVVDGAKHYNSTVISRTGFSISGISEEDKKYPKFWFEQIEKEKPVAITYVDDWRSRLTGFGNIGYNYNRNVNNVIDAVEDKKSKRQTNPCSNCVFNRKNKKKKKKNLEDNHEFDWLNNIYTYV